MNFNEEFEKQTDKSIIFLILLSCQTISIGDFIMETVIYKVAWRETDAFGIPSNSISTCYFKNKNNALDFHETLKNWQSKPIDHLYDIRQITVY